MRHAEQGERGHGQGRSGRRRQRRPLGIRLVEPALLVLLSDKAQHGYNLLEGLQALGLTELHPSKIYRTLNIMEEDGWISSDWDAAETQGPPRRVYKLTAEGSDILRFWRTRLEENQSVMQKLLDRMPQAADES